MFVKPNVDMEIDEKPKKKKRQLTQKQLDGLKRGREKMAEKRKLKKAMEDKKKELAKKKEEDKVIIETSKQHKEKRAEKKKQVKYSEEQEKDYKMKKEKQKKSMDKFNKIKLAAIQYLKTEEEVAEFENIMKGVSQEMSKNPESLYEYLGQHANRLAPPKKNNKKKPKSKVNKEDVI